MVVRFRAVDRWIFYAIRDGEKKIETRAATKKYRNIKLGDKIDFVCGRSRFSKKVGCVKIFKSVSALLKKYKSREVNPKCETRKELQEMYDSFPGYKEKIKKYGIVALELN